MIVADVATVTANVVAANVAVVDPAVTVTLAGTVADALLLDSVTTAPPEGAPVVSVTVPVDPVPPTTLAGLTDTDASAGAGGTGVTVRVEVRVTPA